MEELRKDYESDEEEKPKHKLHNISPDVFTSIAFPMLSQAKNEANMMNKLPVPEINKWDALVKALSIPGGILRDSNCTGQCLHELALKVEWQAGPIGKAKKNSLCGWACKPTTRIGSASNSGVLGYNLGEAAVNLWMKMEFEDFNPVRKPMELHKRLLKKQKQQQ